MQAEQEEEDEEVEDILELCRTRGRSLMTRTQEPPGLTALKTMMEAMRIITSSLGMKLEPFQLDAFRAAVCSRTARLLKEDQFKYMGTVLQLLGVLGSVELQTLANRDIKLIYQDLCSRFITVVAPRRNGKSKCGKLFVAVNAVAENGACIVLIAHQINAVLLYKDDILLYLNTVKKKYNFDISSNATTIRLQFKDPARSSSLIHFVAGGFNVSIPLFFFI